MNSDNASIGHKIISTIIDSHFIEFITNRLISALTQFDASISNYLKIECEIVIEMCYYLLSIGINRPTVGMTAVGIDPVINISNDHTYSLKVLETDVAVQQHQLLLIIYYMIKFAVNKLSYISVHQQWNRTSHSNASNRNHSSDSGGSIDDSWKKSLSRVLHYGDMIIRLTGIGHYVSFLVNGDYPLVLYRLIGMKMIMGDHDSSSSRAGYKSSQLYLESRKMLWVVVLGLISAISMTVDFQYMRLYLYFQLQQAVNLIHTAYNYCSADDIWSNYLRYFRRSNNINSNTSGSRDGNSSGGGNDGDMNDGGNHDNRTEISGVSSSNVYSYESPDVILSDAPSQGEENSSSTSIVVDMTCGICNSIAEMPHQLSCGHVYCYLCIYHYEQASVTGFVPADNTSKCCPRCRKPFKDYFPVAT